MERQLETREKNTLRNARDLLKEIALKEERLRELRTQIISSPNMDGMPKGAGGGDALAARVIAIERRESELERDRRRLDALRQAGRGALARLKPEQRMFYASYYLTGSKASEARAEAGISKRTASRYLRAMKAE